MASPGQIELHGNSFPVYGAQVRTILSRTSGFIARAGFTHSLNPARNCLYGCTYCYVPTLKLYGGLSPDDWRRWGHRTTFKRNAPALLRRQLRSAQVIYCSPLVDPYQPAERFERSMPPILETLCDHPPAVFVLQTRGPLILRDIDLLRTLAKHTRLRVSFSLTTDNDNVRRLYEPRCEAVESRIKAMRTLTDAGIAVHCTLAPILPCDPARLAELALSATACGVIADPLHTRQAKPRGATTRPEAMRISAAMGFERWHQPEFQAKIVREIRSRIEAGDRCFGVGEDGFRMLTIQRPSETFAGAGA